MVKFTLRIFQSCRSKDPSTLPEHPAPPCQRHKIINVDFQCTTLPPPSKQPPHRSSFKSHVSSAFGCRSKPDNPPAPEDFQWHVVAKLYDEESPRPKMYSSSIIAGVDSDDEGDEGFQLPLLPLPPFHKKKNRRGRKVKSKRPRHFAASSADSRRFSTDYTVVHDQEEEEQPETLISSPRSLSTDSPTGPSPLPRRHKVKKTRAPSKHNGDGVSPEWGSPARLSVFTKLMPCKVEGKVKESFAVVKRSENPYEDFKKSMMEMIVEKQMYEESDLKQLLQCFLSLNSRCHHGMIMEAFSDIWDTMTGDQ